MQIAGLGYIVIESTDAARWHQFGTEVLGAMSAPDMGDDGGVYLKLDEWSYRIAVIPGARDRLLAAGWELSGIGAFEKAVRELETLGYEVEQATDQEAAQRRVQGLARTQDPSGNAVELFYGPVLDHTRFVSPTGVSAFVTGELGLGHVVLPVSKLTATHTFYCDVLGFALSDSMQVPAVAVPGRDPGQGPAALRFYHCNPRHHSLALFEAEVPTGLVHLMLEVETIDEVGYAMDRCAKHSVPVSGTLGRHSNDHMVSFYMQTPGGFDIEYGYGGLLLDPANHCTSEFTKVSFWGHVFGPKPA